MGHFKHSIWKFVGNTLPSQKDSIYNFSKEIKKQEISWKYLKYKHINND